MLTASDLVHLKLFALLLTLLLLVSVQVFEGDELLQLNLVLSRRFFSLNRMEAHATSSFVGPHGCLVDELVV